MRPVNLMEWNSKTPLEWDLENMDVYGSKAFEVPTRLQFYSHKIDEAKESKQMYESGVGSGSGFGDGSTSQNSYSATENSSAKEGQKSWTTVDVFPKDISKKEEFSGVDNSGGFPCLTSGAPMTGLKLGRQTYSKDMSSCSTDKSTSYSLYSTSSCPTTKRTRQSHYSMHTQRCQVEGCNLDLVSAKGYHRRHKICENHSKSPKVIVAGMERRFCQQCSRFHDLSEFDDKKRSCRRRLSDHNFRRRRPQPEATQFNSTQLYDQRPQMNFLPNRVAIPVANQTWGTDCLFRGTLASNSWISHKNVSSSDEVIAPRTLYNDESAFTFNLDVASGFRHAPSLLSSNSWASNQHEPESLQQLVNGNHIVLAHPLMRSNMHTWAVNSMEYVQVQVEQTPSATDKHLLNFNSNAQLQHHDPLNTTHESDFFYSNRID